MTGKRTLKDRGLVIKEAGPDNPVYRRGWIIGGTGMKKPFSPGHKLAPEETTPEKEKK